MVVQTYALTVSEKDDIPRAFELVCTSGENLRDIFSNRDVIEVANNEHMNSSVVCTIVFLEGNEYDLLCNKHDSANYNAAGQALYDSVDIGSTVYISKKQSDGKRRRSIRKVKKTKKSKRTTRRTKKTRRGGNSKNIVVTNSGTTMSQSEFNAKQDRLYQEPY